MRFTLINPITKRCAGVCLYVSRKVRDIRTISMNVKANHEFKYMATCTLVK